MVAREQIASASITDFNNNQLDLIYYVVQGESNSFGISIDMRSQSNVETETVDCITKSKDYVVSLALKLAKNTVSPCTLLYIIDDLYE